MGPVTTKYIAEGDTFEKCTQTKEVPVNALTDVSDNHVGDIANPFVVLDDNIPYGEKRRRECELFVEKYFGLSDKFPVDALVPDAQYYQLVNVLVMFREDTFKDLQAQLDAANKKIAELEAENKRLWNSLHDASN